MTTDKKPDMLEDRKAETTPAAVDGKGEANPGNLGAKMTEEKDKKEGAAADLPKPGISNTTPKGQIDSSAPFKPKLRPGAPETSMKRASAMDRNGDFNPARHGEFDPKRK